jgi:hypothetical protein
LAESSFPGARRSVVDFQRHLHVLDGAEERNQVRFLDNKAKMATAEFTQVHPGFIGVHDQFTANDNTPGSGRVDQADGRDQGRFACAARAQRCRHFHQHAYDRG